MEYAEHTIMVVVVVSEDDSEVFTQEWTAAGNHVFRCSSQNGSLTIITIYGQLVEPARILLERTGETHLPQELN